VPGDAGVDVVVLVEESFQEQPSICQGCKGFWEIVEVFEGFKLRLAVVFVVGYPWPGMRSDATAWTVVPSVVEQVAEHYRGIAVDGSA
jgi:hypothetical protein